MINYVAHAQIDKQKYDACISLAVQTKIYAFSWYLDAVTETWDALILSDYEAVMPLPKRKKYGLTYIFQPYWIQHLGLFSKSALQESDVNLFMDQLPKSIKLIDYNVNFKGKKTKTKINYILPLRDGYKQLLKGYSKLRKRGLNKAIKAGLVIEQQNTWADILDLSNQKSETEFKINDEARLKLDKLLNKALQLEKLSILKVYTTEQELIGGALYMISEHRITYLFSVINQKGKDLQAMTFMMNWVIKTYVKTNYILDFEGSMLPGVAQFIKSFGAENESYYHLKKWHLF